VPFAGIGIDCIEEDIGIEADPLNAHGAHPAKGSALRGVRSG
jgi:hypothetical protein